MIWDCNSPLFCYFSINSYSSQCFQEKSSMFSNRNDPFEGRNWWKNRIMKTWFGITKWNHILKSHFRKHDFVWKLMFSFNSLLINNCFDWYSSVKVENIINHTKSVKETLFFKTWFVAKYDSIKNNKIHEAS